MLVLSFVVDGDDETDADADDVVACDVCYFYAILYGGGGGGGCLSQ